jgi:hypothetical protein
MAGHVTHHFHADEEARGSGEIQNDLPHYTQQRDSTQEKKTLEGLCHQSVHFVGTKEGNTLPRDEVLRLYMPLCATYPREKVPRSVLISTNCGCSIVTAIASMCID